MKKDQVEILADRIRRKRRERDMTQAQLARKIGANSAGYICDIEKGRKSFPIETLLKLEKLFGPLWGNWEHQ